MSILQEKYYEDNRGRDLRLADPLVGRRNWVVNEMWDVHHEIARRIVLGQKNVTIADELNVSAQMVSMVRNSPIVQEHIAILRGAADADTVDLAKEIREVAPTALKLLRDIIEGENDGANASLPLRAKMATDMVARAGHGVPQRVQSENVHAFITSEDIAAIKKRAIENGDVIEVKAEESLEVSVDS